MAVTWGTPTPATTRVVQMEPGPMPTFTASAPALASATAPSAVATLPAMICALGKVLRMSATASSTPRECPCAVSTTITSQPAASSASTRADAIGADAHGGAAAQAPVLVLGGGGVLLRLLDVLDGDEAPQLAAGIDDQQLLDAVGVQQLLGFFQAGPLGHGDELLGHHGADRLLQVALEADVAVGDDADRAPVGGHHRQARDLVPLHQLQRLGQLLVGADGDRVDDHAGLGLLDLLHLQRLLGDGQVLVNDADAALARHADGGARPR